MSSHYFRLIIKVWQYRNGLVVRGLGETQLRLPGSLIGDVMESGALFSFAGSPTRVLIRVGVSFLSEEQACANAESEVGTATFDQIQAQSKASWNERLSRIEIDVPHTPPNVTELLYSSLYRASLTPVSQFSHFEGRIPDMSCGKLRTMLQARPKEIFWARNRLILIHCTAGSSI